MNADEHGEESRLRRVRWLLGVVMVGLVVSGLTAIPLEREVSALAWVLRVDPNVAPAEYGGVRYWMAHVRQGLSETYAKYPFVAYGTDWLAYAHFIIALLFVGPWREPVRNRWVIDWGLIACVLIVPTAVGFGAVRGIPGWWRVIDCSFGVVAGVVLWMVRREVREMEIRSGKSEIRTKPEARS